MTDDPSAPAGDLRTRIRDAAIEQFAKLGFKGASVRGIAAAAGVSPGLVQHHFSTKEKLREECDAYLLSAIQGLRISVLSGRGLPGGGAFVADSARQLAQLMPYLTRSLLDGDSDVASTWFEAAAAEYRTAFTDERFAPSFPPDTDLEGVVAVYTAMQLGLGIFMNEVGRHLNVDTSDPTTLVRLAKARLFVAGQQLLTEDVHGQLDEGFETFLREYQQHDQPDAPDHGDSTESGTSG